MDPTIEPKDRTPMSAALLRRLAETADGYRDNIRRWIVTSYSTPTVDMLKSFESQEDAERYRDKLNKDGGDYDVFGPYQTPPSGGRRAPSGHKFAVQSVTVQISEGDTTYTKVLAGGEFDALFWSESALDKFAVPYYVSVADLDFGVKVRNDFRRDRVCMLLHRPDTTYRAEYLTREGGGEKKDTGDGFAFTMLEP